MVQFTIKLVAHKGKSTVTYEVKCALLTLILHHCVSLFLDVYNFQCRLGMLDLSPQYLSLATFVPCPG